MNLVRGPPGFGSLPPSHRLQGAPIVASASSPSRSSLYVVAWADPVVDRLGFDPRSQYTETFWLPLLGPTSTWLLRRFAVEFDRQPDGFSLDEGDCARSIGIGHRGGMKGPFHRAIERCIRFGMVRDEGNDILGVRRRVPPLDRTQANRLPRRLRGPHRRWLAEQRSRARHPSSDAHAARLARSLFDVGATTSDVQDQLRRWNFDDVAILRAIRSAADAAIVS